MSDTKNINIHNINIINVNINNINININIIVVNIFNITHVTNITNIYFTQILISKAFVDLLTNNTSKSSQKTAVQIRRIWTTTDRCVFH